MIQCRKKLAKILSDLALKIDNPLNKPTPKIATVLYVENILQERYDIIDFLYGTNANFIWAERKIRFNFNNYQKDIILEPKSCIVKFTDNTIAIRYPEEMYT